jgi:hypothetical protein
MSYLLINNAMVLNFSNLLLCVTFVKSVSNNKEKILVLYKTKVELI